MKITHHWLREFTPVDVTPRELASQLTLAGLEVESVTPVAPPFSGVVVGEVMSTARHPDAGKLAVCEVATDAATRVQIVCGAPNARAGLKVAVALAGAALPGAVSIEPTQIRGVESNGMLCSARELGLSEEHEGILELPHEALLGTELRAALDLEDTALEVNATPNRGDCMSVFGIARDYAAAHHGRHLEYRAVPVAAASEEVFPVRIEAPAACPAFACRVVRGLVPGGITPYWLRERLRRVGLKSISPIVDVTNYVMIELGQPMHAYDLDRLQSGLEVRLARPGETLRLLDDNDYTLDPDMLVIADARGAIGLAGIMGGRDTAIGESTTAVLLEAAHFTPKAVAGRARRFGLFTDAGQRFERGVDPTLPARAIERATELLLRIAGGKPGPTSFVAAPDLPGAQTREDDSRRVSLRRRRLDAVLGSVVPDDEVTALLKAVAGEIETTADGWAVIAPPHRFDLHIEADLIEEVARLRGFDSIAETPASVPQVPGTAPESRVPQERVLNAMADMGFREVITYSFVDPELQRRLFPDASVLALSNAISPELSELRVSLWTGLIQAARENLRRQQSRVRLFEMGTKFVVQAGTLREVESLAGLATGARWPEQWSAARDALDFHDLKNDLARLWQLAGGAAEFQLQAATVLALRPGRSASILRQGVTVGAVGELHPQLSRALGLPLNLLLFELDVTAAFAAKPSKYMAISKYPTIRRDLAVVVAEAVPLAVVVENVTVAAAGLLSEVRVFDVYRGPGIESTRKSVGLGLILQDSSRTLTDVDADAVVTAVVARLRDVLSASIRD